MAVALLLGRMDLSVMCLLQLGLEHRGAAFSETRLLLDLTEVVVALPWPAPRLAESVALTVTFAEEHEVFQQEQEADG